MRTVATAESPIEDALEAAPIRYWPVDPRLSRFVTGYHRYRVAVPPGEELRDVLFPSWGVLRMALAPSQPWSLARGPRTFDPVPTMMLEGPSSLAGRVRSTGGTLVGFGILPLGWRHLVGKDAASLANRVVPAESLIAGIGEVRHALEVGTDPREALDAFLLARFAGAPDPDPMIDSIAAMLDDPAFGRVELMEEALGIPNRVLVALCKAHFGFTPKLLVRRGRFLRALGAALTREGEWADVIERAGYWDRSHFLRDSNQFLGCSIRDFLAQRGPFNMLALQARAEALGTPV